MPSLHESRTLTVSVARAPEDVYAYVSDPSNLPAWAQGLARGVRRGSDGWIVETAEGDVGLAFVPRNAHGVLDHTVRLPDGTHVAAPMRVVPNGDGSEVMFTLFRRDGMTPEEFARDVGLVERDLATLKRLMETVDEGPG